MIKKTDILAQAQMLSDWDIIQKVLAGEKVLLEILYDRYADKVFHKCLSIIKDPDESKDLCHDIMIKIFLNLHQFKGSADFSFWVKSVAYNFCMDYLKKKKRIRFDDFETSQYEQTSIDEIELENKVLKDLQLDQLEVLLKQIKSADKLILLMRYQDGMSVKKISTTLKIGESAVKMRLKRSRDHLAKLLKEIQHER